MTHVRVAHRSRSSLVALALLAVLLFAATWVGARAWLAKGELQQAQSQVSALKAQITTGQYAGATNGYVEIRRHTIKARRLTHDPVWNVAEHVPFVGPNLIAMRDLTTVIDDAMQVSEPLVGLATRFSPESLAPRDGALPLDPFVEAATAVTGAADGFARLDQRIKEIPMRGTLPQLQAAQVQLSTLISGVSGTLGEAAPMVRTLPGMLGANAPRTYVVMFQNNAELRSLGGTALSFVEISVDHGAIKVTRAVPAGGDNFPQRSTPVIPIPDGFDGVYGGALGRFIANATIRPSSISAAEVIRAEWQQKFGEHIDGVVSVDAGALALLVKAVGPITLSSGEVMTSDNTVSFLLNEVYTRYNSGNISADNIKQNEVYAEAVNLTFARLSSGKFDAVTLLTSVRSAAAANRLSFWFADPGEQATFAHTSGGAQDLLQSTATEDGVGIYLNDQVGSKLSYYLGSKLTTGSAVCTPDGRQVHRLTLAMTNTLPPESVARLSESISGSGYRGLGLKKGAQRIVLFIYLPPGATLLAASTDGAPVAATGQHDVDHPVQTMWVTIPPGGASEVSVDVLMGAPGVRKLVTEVTPTVQGTQLATTPLECGTVKLP